MPSLPAPSSSIDAWLRARSPSELADLGGRFARRTAELGLAVTLAEGGEKPIPPLLTPVVVDPAWIQSQVAVVGVLAGLVRRVAVGLLAGPERAAILDGLFPFERTAVELRGVPEVLATLRADLFLDAPHARALELNTTIPAMQGYSDIAAQALIELLAPAEAEALVRKNGENAIALLTALRAFYRARSERDVESIALVHRPADSQLSELRYLARRWDRAGVRTTVVEVGQVGRDAAGRPTAGGIAVDLIYRHIFARRIDAGTAMAELLLDPAARSITNAVSAPLELKRVFAELSACLDEPERAARYGLSEGELQSVRPLVPWTRPLVAGPGRVPGGARVADLVEHIASDPADFVIKRSWDYGGKAVFLGFEADLPSTRERAAATFGEPLAWPDLVRRAATDVRGGGFVAQQRVTARTSPRLVVGPEGPAWRPMYEDFSVFASLGLPEVPWGGVCRASLSAIVNIAGGGGVAPVLSIPVAEALARAIGAAPASDAR